MALPFAPIVVAIERPASLAGHQTGASLPVVRLMINGSSGLFLFDTGSTHTVIAKSTARALGLKAVSSGSGQDGVGASVRPQLLEEVTVRTPAAVTVGKVEQPLGLDLPPLEQLGLAGVISPLQINGPTCLTANFRKGEAVFGDESARAPTVKPDYLERAPSGLIYAIVSVPGGSPVKVLLDSGARRTALPLRALSGAHRGKEESSLGASGQMVSMHTVGPVTVRVGPHTLTLPEVDIAPDAAGARIGFDLLQHATFSTCRGEPVALVF